MTFNIKEGPTVKVGNIRFTGNQNLNSRTLALCHAQPAAHRHSRTPSSWRTSSPAPTTPASWKKTPSGYGMAYQNHGYFKAIVGEPSTHIRNEGGLSLLTFRPKKGKRIDITLPSKKASAIGWAASPSPAIRP